MSEKFTITPAAERLADQQDRAEKLTAAAEQGEERISDKLEELDLNLEDMELFQRVDFLKQVLQKAYEETGDYYLSEYLAGVVRDAEIDMEEASLEAQRPAWAKQRADQIGLDAEDMQMAA